MPSITPDQVRDLWNHPNTAHTIELGDEFAPIGKEDLAALLDSDDFAEDGTLTDQAATALAAHLGETADTLDDPRERAVAHLGETVRARNELRAEYEARLAEADAEIGVAVRSCFAARVPMRAMERELGVKRQRVYQIRDGRR